MHSVRRDGARGVHDRSAASFDCASMNEIPGARFVALEGRNHAILEGEPAWTRLIAEIKGFIAS